MRNPAPVLLALLALLLGACGEDTPQPVPDHGLETTPFAGVPRGEPVVVRYDVPDGAVFEATLSVHTTVSRRGTMESRKQDRHVELRATAVMTWTLQRPRADAPPTSRIQLRYVDAEGHRAEDVLERDPILGDLRHAADGRPIPSSLVLRGGTKAEQVEAQDLIGSLLLAGFGGAPAWIPARAVQEQESWGLQGFLELRAAANMQARARELGVDAPAPRLEGRVRLRKVRREVDATLMELELDGLLEMKGTLSKDGRTGQMSAGNLFQGQATVDAATGIPRTFDVQHTNTMRIRSGEDDLVVGGTTMVRGTVKRTDQGR